MIASQYAQSAVESAWIGQGDMACGLQVNSGMRIPTEQQIELERLIDRHGLASLMDAISEIATDKALHVRDNWQDGALAKRWEKAAKLFADAAEKVHGFGLW